MSGKHLTYYQMASKGLCFPPRLARGTFWNLSWSHGPMEYLWEFQSLPLILYLSQECCVRNHNSPHILRIINLQAITGKFRVTAPWVKPCWKAARRWASGKRKVFVRLMPTFLLLSNLKILSGDKWVPGIYLDKVQGPICLFSWIFGELKC